MKKNKKDITNSKRPFISKILIIVLLISLVYIYARYIGTIGIKVKVYNVVNENLPESFDGFTIAHFSDMELGTTFNIENLPDLVEKINNLKPNIVVFTGDIVHSNCSLTLKEKKILIEELGKIDPEIGKYSVRGDDDVYTDLYNEVMTAANFKDISNSYELIYYKGLTPIVMYGLDSLNANRQDYNKTFSYPQDNDDTNYMATYRILLAHEPDSVDFIKDYNISLMLSGHSHNSEFNIPFLKDFYNIKGASKYYDENYKINGMELYISSGLGTSKFKIRFMDKPSISLYKLYKE